MQKTDPWSNGCPESGALGTLKEYCNDLIWSGFILAWMMINENICLDNLGIKNVQGNYKYPSTKYQYQ